MLWYFTDFHGILGDKDQFLAANLFFALAKMPLLYHSEYSAEQFRASFG